MTLLDIWPIDKTMQFNHGTSGSIWDIVHMLSRNFRNGDYVVTVQCLFCWNFILLWVEAFRTIGSVMKRKLPGLSCSVWTSESIDTVKRAILMSQIIHKVTGFRFMYITLLLSSHTWAKFYPYERMSVHHLTKRNYVQCKNFEREW